VSDRLDILASVSSGIGSYAIDVPLSTNTNTVSTTGKIHLRLVYENKVSDSGWNGIALRSDADYNYVLENSVSSSTNIGILVKMSTHNLIYGNKVSHSGLWDLCDSSSPPPLANTWRDNKYKTSNF